MDLSSFFESGNYQSPLEDNFHLCDRGNHTLRIPMSLEMHPLFRSGRKEIYRVGILKEQELVVIGTDVGEVSELT